MFPQTPLSQFDGYIILISFGTVFTIGMIGITYCLQRYHGENRMSTETFFTANRKVKSGLIASTIVSSMTWAATLLQSSSVTYSYGISGAFWYASGAAVTSISFSIVAIEFKRRAPFAHTFPEVVRARYGREGHLVFILFCLFTNIVITAMLLTGGAAVINSLSRMHIVAACFLLPLGTIIYTYFGGIKATFLINYIHTVIILLIILFFSIVIFRTSSILGSFSVIYNLLVNASSSHPIEGNYQGSYLTLTSRGGAMFFLINLIGSFGAFFLDNGYYNKAIATFTNSVGTSYILGGLAWFAVPFLTGTTMGLGAIVLENHPSFPTYPNRLSIDDVTAGLILPATAITLLGKTGSTTSFIILYMACTSAMSAQLISVSAIISLDIYRTYLHPNANGKQIIFISHLSIICFALMSSVLSIGLYYSSINLGYLYSIMGILISSAVLPAISTLFWKRQSKLAVCLSPLMGLICSILSWLLTTKYVFGEINIETSGSNLSMLVGNLVALLSPLLFIPLFTFIKPDAVSYDFVSMRAIDVIDSGLRNSNKPSDEETERSIVYLKKQSRFVRLIAIVITLCLTVIIPWPIYTSSYIFSKTFFTIWIIIGIICIIISFFIIGIYPLVENFGTIKSVLRLIYFDIRAFYEHE